MALKTESKGDYGSFNSSKSDDSSDQEEVEVVGDSIPPPDKYRGMKTLALFTQFMGLAFGGCIVGPTMVSMVIYLNTDMRTLSGAFMGMGFGKMVGAIGTGFLYERVNKELYFGLWAVVMGISMGIAPYTGSIQGFIATMCFVGLAFGFVDTGGQVYMLNLWRGHRWRDSLIQALHGVFSLGATLGPLAIKPFIPDLSFLQSFKHNMTLGGDLNASLAAWGSGMNWDWAFSLANGTLLDGDLNGTWNWGNGSWYNSSSLDGDVYSANGSVIARYVLDSTNASDAVGTTSAPLELWNSTDWPSNSTTDDWMSAWMKDSTTEPPSDFEWGSWAGNANGSLIDAVNSTVLFLQQSVALVKFSYVLLASWLIVPLILFTVLFFVSGPSCQDKDWVKQKEGKSSEKDIAKTAESTVVKEADGKRQFIFRICYFIFIFLEYFWYVWLESSFSGYLASFVVKGLDWPNGDGALITACFWGAHGIGRIVAVPLSLWVKPHHFLVGDLVLSLTAVTLMFFSEVHYAIPWVGSVLMGLGLSTFFASGLLIASSRIVLDGKASAVFLVASSAAWMVGPVLVGWMFDSEGHMWVVYLCLVAAVLLTLSVSAAEVFNYFFTRKDKRRGRHQAEEEEGVVARENSSSPDVEMEPLK